MNIIASVTNILIKGQQMGLAEDQFEKIYLQFAKEYLPLAYGVLSKYVGDTDTLFGELVSLINMDSEIAKIIAALTRIS